jgi:hypothetical protein
LRKTSPPRRTDQTRGAFIPKPGRPFSDLQDAEGKQRKGATRGGRGIDRRRLDCDSSEEDFNDGIFRESHNSPIQKWGSRFFG